MLTDGSCKVVFTVPWHFPLAHPALPATGKGFDVTKEILLFYYL